MNLCTQELYTREAYIIQLQRLTLVLKKGFIKSMNSAPFQGDKKLPLKSPLAKIERKIIDRLVPGFPSWIEGYHLTLMTIPLSAVMIISGLLARQNISWLWVSSACLFAQWFTDSFDGSLGRYRDTGIPKWGYYMDHLLDYVFMSSIIVGYALLLDGSNRTLLLCMVPVFGLSYVNSFLSFSATNEFKITFMGVGPTELRFSLIFLNAAAIIFGTGFMKAGIVPASILVAASIGIVIYRTQKYIWNIDMKDKERRTK
jgi:archaetidylinositol phosphate synthase